MYVCVCVYITLKCDCPLLSQIHCVSGPCAAVVRETLNWYRLTFLRWIPAEYFNRPAALFYPRYLWVSVCECTPQPVPV